MQATPQRRVKFGSPETTLLTKGLAALEKRPLAELLFKDVAAFNIPKIALSRTWKERWDTATLELSNSGITLLSSLALPQVVRPPVNWLTGLSQKYVAANYLQKEFKDVTPKLIENKLPQLPAKMARMGASFGFLFPFAAAFWAAPFARNWLTMKRTHSANFESMIGFDGTNAKQPKRTLAQEMSYQRNTALKILGAGAGLSLASILGFGLVTRNLGKNMGGKLYQKLSDGAWKKGFEAFFKTFDLKGNQVQGQPATLIFWGLPAYLGWVHGARSGNERRERVVQSANAIFWFFFASKLTTPVWKLGYQKVLNSKALEQCETILKTSIEKEKIKDVRNKLLSLTYEEIKHDFSPNPELMNKLLNFKNAKFALNDLGIPITSLSAVQFFNFNLTEKKIKGVQPQSRTQPTTPPAPNQSPTPSGLSSANQPFGGAPKQLPFVMNLSTRQWQPAQQPTGNYS